MDRVEETIDEDEVSFAPAPSPEEARAKLAALRGKPLDAPSRLVTEEPVAEPAMPAVIPAAVAALSSGLTDDTVAALLKLLEDTTRKAETQKTASAVRKADKPLFKVVKVRITTRIDADVLDAFKATGPGWQTLLNDVLRQNMPT